MHSKYYTSRVLYIPLYPTNSLIVLSHQWVRTINRKRFFGTKPLLCRYFSQHYYRGTFIESHRKPTEVPQISYGGPETCKSLFLYQRYTKGIQKTGKFSRLYQKCSKYAIYCKNIWTHQIFSLPLQSKCRNLCMNMRQIQ